MFRSLIKIISTTFLLFLVLSSNNLLANNIDEQGSKSTDSINAVWQEHKGRIFYSSFSILYSCDGIENEVEKLLGQLGAKDVKARAQGCFSNKVDGSISVKVRFKTLSVNPDVEGESVKAQFEEVDFNQIARQHSSRRSGNNCDVIRAISKSVIENFEHEVLKKQAICSPSRTSFPDVDFKVKVLKAI